MKVPVSWLKDYVEIDATAEDIGEKLTFSGVEVEGIESVGLGYEHVVVGEVLSIESHPQADRLSVCRVNDGNEELQVVCGADNFAVGDKAPLAKIGAELAGGFKVKRAKLRGSTPQPAGSTRWRPGAKPCARTAAGAQASSTTAPGWRWADRMGRASEP